MLLKAPFNHLKIKHLFSLASRFCWYLNFNILIYIQFTFKHIILAEKNHTNPLMRVDATSTKFCSTRDSSSDREVGWGLTDRSISFCFSDQDFSVFSNTCFIIKDKNNQCVSYVWIIHSVLRRGQI